MFNSSFRLLRLSPSSSSLSTSANKLSLLLNNNYHSLSFTKLTSIKSSSSSMLSSTSLASLLKMNLSRHHHDHQCSSSACNHQHQHSNMSSNNQSSTTTASTTLQVPTAATTSLSQSSSPSISSPRPIEYSEDLKELLDRNKEWAARVEAEQPGFFASLSKQQKPKLLWIGCSDSRVPANQITGLLPGEVFVHRNIANLVVHSDMNCLSVLQFAVEVLQVEHIIICGHSRCGGVATALTTTQYGLLDNWIRYIKDVAHRHSDELKSINDNDKRVNRLVELNVQAQVNNLSHTTIVQNAWRRKQKLIVHGWYYDINDGLLKEVTAPVSQLNDIDPSFLTKPNNSQ